MTHTDLAAIEARVKKALVKLSDALHEMLQETMGSSLGDDRYVDACGCAGDLLDAHKALAKEVRRLLAVEAVLKAQRDDWARSAEMACEMPDPACSCPGCSLAREESRKP